MPVENRPKGKEKKKTKGMTSTKKGGGKVH